MNHRMFEKRSKCQMCGKEIVNHNGLKKYCSACRKKKRGGTSKRKHCKTKEKS